jgi:membrane fusion protein (multidrug efflux system)
VEVAKVESMTLVDETQAVGSLRSRQGVMLRPEVGGRVKQILFSDGQRVRKGQLMVQFEDQLQQAQVAQARAELSIAEANHKRNQELVAQNFISQRSLDESAAALEVSRAKLSLAQATLQRLQVLAPFDGITGLKQINVGDYLKDGADMVNVEDIDAVLLDFRLPERFQAKVRAGQKAQLTVDALPGRPFSAIVQAVDPLIEANGRSVGVRGCIDNRQQQLRPGMFARVNAVFGSRDNALVIPEEAIIPQGGRTFVVKVVQGDKPDVRVSERVAVKVGLRSSALAKRRHGRARGGLAPGRWWQAWRSPWATRHCRAWCCNTRSTLCRRFACRGCSTRCRSARCSRFGRWPTQPGRGPSCGLDRSQPLPEGSRCSSLKFPSDGLCWPWSCPC